MKNKYLLDTNVVIYFFNGLTDDRSLVEILRSSFNISIITKIEFLSWQKLLSDVALNDKAIEFISNATVYELDEVVANRTIINRQQYKIKTPDAIIGATAQVHGFEIVTNNVDDFKMLDLKVTTVELKE
ncbi:type II toxin-antitoxin system VapC family toxin [Thiomicrospira cyclica]|uniref:PilT protein domain protein n=1 Tax=Thiomicrospira cyclica (strain DSM 14477 / JCM 11371 / ALM1) TaxID=717773 RepID=F6DCU6_THICA|nr:type II toxin-antitoxin system VapC family toxin [Thiomicrospira cyclica]AEG31682.1 PilT protein domain protein [Thiomicrospira cyclica ALM1]